MPVLWDHVVCWTNRTLHFVEFAELLRELCNDNTEIWLVARNIYRHYHVPKRKRHTSQHWEHHLISSTEPGIHRPLMFKSLLYIGILLNNSTSCSEIALQEFNPLKTISSSWNVRTSTFRNVTLHRWEINLTTWNPKQPFIYRKWLFPRTSHF